MKILLGISRALSHFFSPIMMATYGVFFLLWGSMLCYQDVFTRVVVLGLSYVITGVLPFIFILLLHRFGQITDIHLVDRRERVLPYMFTILCYVALSMYMQHIHAPMWVNGMMWGATLAVAVDLLINFVWKISGHMTGMGGLLSILICIDHDGVAAFDFEILMCIFIVLCGVIGTARMIMERHTLGQVFAGFLNGFFCVALMHYFFVAH